MCCGIHGSWGTCKIPGLKTFIGFYYNIEQFLPYLKEQFTKNVFVSLSVEQKKETFQKNVHAFLFHAVTIQSDHNCKVKV